jgi:DNA-binding NarL/FixJ family response regulator
LSSGLKFIIADDHPLFRGALIEALKSLSNTAEIIETGDFDGAKQAVEKHADADLLLLDLSMPGVTGLSGIVTLQAMQPALPIVVVSATDNSSTIRRALDLGASGFISKSANLEAIKQSVNQVLEGGLCMPEGIDSIEEGDAEINDLIKCIQTLTPQQARVLGMLAEGLLNKQIAYELGVSEATVKAHVSAVLQKLGVDSRTQAVIRLSKIASEPTSPLG